MARPSKYTSELTKQLVKYIADGLNICDACYGVGISVDTFCRWRKEKPEFDKAVIEATNAQTWSSAALAQTSEYRRYTRKQKREQKTTQSMPKGIDTQLERNNAILGLLRKLQSDIMDTQGADSYLGARLPKRSEPPVDEFGELVLCEPYLNTTTNRVEWIEKENGRCVLHTCHIDIWDDKTRKLLFV